MKPVDVLLVGCFIDADFAGQWNVEDPQDPLCVKSRMGYVLMITNCPIHWVSKLQMELAVLTMEVEYIALSTTMRDLIPLQMLVFEIKDLFGTTNLQFQAYSNVFKTMVL